MSTRIINLRGLRVRVAGSFAARLVGLLGRRTLAPGEALLLVPCNNVHTFFMRFAIDVVFVDRRGVILTIVPRLMPWRVAAAKGAHGCLELAGGTAAGLGLAPGQHIAQLATGKQAR
jgi:uncharacterized membrane protein (UPF0127 family)